MIVPAAMAALVAVGILHAVTPNLRPGDQYVAMGSSFAAGPGIADQVIGSPARCGRSTGNYAGLLAPRLGLRLTDVSCSGATTRDLLHAAGELPAQVEAVTASTRLVTITIGGNDVGYVAGLGAETCSQLKLTSPACPEGQSINEGRWRHLEQALFEIVRRVRLRSPKARIIFVDYLAILPPKGLCAALPLSPAGAERSRAVARRLAATTTRAARRANAEVLRVSRLSARHHACSSVPWTTGFRMADGKLVGIPFHPNKAGMEAVAAALWRHVGP